MRPPRRDGAGGAGTSSGASGAVGTASGQSGRLMGIKESGIESIGNIDSVASARTVGAIDAAMASDTVATSNVLCSSPANGQLSSTFYVKTCPKALSIVKAAVKQAVAKEKRMGASLVRLHFHDCFVNGCDGSIQLDDTTNFTGIKTARPNNNSVRGYGVIDTIKAQLEAACTGIVSCADILAIAARDSVVELGGPTWRVQLGRRDSRNASLSGANSQIPAPTSDLSALISSFSNKGLSTKDMIVLSGAHTIGQARCTSFKIHIYNETNINSAFATSLKAKCPITGGDDNLSPLDVQTPTVFDRIRFGSNWVLLYIVGESSLLCCEFTNFHVLYYPFAMVSIGSETTKGNKKINFQNRKRKNSSVKYIRLRRS
ncbi:cationic peroxidase 1-like [Cryptomeria japonica]|uniref:cationic peroxidase 1-like n=1 Tax=Cryptomeria japonica TaxID=3369 RepID=UPI0027D9FA39|nr:cationic peroxidase 1-like [Cryptomeria japonica]